MKPFDLSKFKKEYTKKYKIESGFFDPKTFIDSGSALINKLISNDYYKGFPLDGKVNVLAGESGSGKSYIISGNCIRWCLANDVQVVLFDAENALDRSWMKALKVDVDNTKNLIRFPVSSPDDVGNAVDMLMKQYSEDHAHEPYDERPKMLFVLDSIGMLMTKTEQEQMGDTLKGVMGQKAKQLKALVSNCLRLFSGHPVGLIASNHTYESSNMFKPGDVVSGGNGFVFAASVVCILNKLKLKEEEDGTKVTEVLGIRSKVSVFKSRYSRPHVSGEVNIPYTHGMSRYSGLVQYWEDSGVLKKVGNMLEYTDPNGEVFKFFAKKWKTDHELLEKVMKEDQAKDDNVIIEGIDRTSEFAISDLD